MLGDQRAWDKVDQKLPDINGFKFIDIEDLDADMLIKFPAQIVLSTLSARDRDVIEIAQMLSDFGFKGRYRAIADGIPNTELIVKEVAAVASELDFEVLNLPPDEQSF